MQQNKIISASILSANFAQLGQEVQNVLSAGADWVHFDVMDYHYVPNLTFGAQICKALRNFGIIAPIDVHLMVKKVNPLIKDFAQAGASLISFHPFGNPAKTKQSIDLIHSYDVKAGLVINPNQNSAIIESFLADIDLVLVMSVYPGFAAQKFIPATMKNVKKIRKLIDRQKRKIYLSVDGGINIDNINKVSIAGADTFVAGSAIFKSQNYSQTIKQMRKSSV